MKNKPSVLIVDDEPANIQVLAAVLKARYRIKVATSGQQCLAMLSEIELPDLVLLDIEMLDLNGYEVCEQLKAQSRTANIPIIFVTSRDTSDDEERGLLLGAVDYITKPVSPAIVEARVNTHVTLKQQRDMLEKMALHDQLTGLYNRYYLLEEASHKVAQALRHKDDVSVLMIDIDHFKLINDEHGHPAGDKVLREISTLLEESSRTEDIIARFGGEEFVILLDHCDAENAEVKANIICEKVAALQPDGITVTLSIGVAQLRPEVEDFSEALKRADLALYVAKGAGRNRVVSAETGLMILNEA